MFCAHGGSGGGGGACTVSHTRHTLSAIIRPHSRIYLFFQAVICPEYSQKANQITHLVDVKHGVCVCVRRMHACKAVYFD